MGTRPTRRSRRAADASFLRRITRRPFSALKWQVHVSCIAMQHCPLRGWGLCGWRCLRPNFQWHSMGSWAC